MRILKHGTSGDDVRIWQAFLHSQGYVLTPDGVFGDVTEQRTKAYQEANGLLSDGIVGQATLAVARTQGHPAAAPTSPVRTKPASFVDKLASTHRPHRIVVDTVVLHATAGDSGSGAIAYLKKIGLSYHYVVMDGRNDKYRDGDVVECVPVEMAAHHAGSSYGPREEARGLSSETHPYSKLNASLGRVGKFKAGCSVNPYSIGLSFDNRNDGIQPYTEAQYEAAIALLRGLLGRNDHMLRLKWLTTHYAVSPGRKSDPRKIDIDRIADATGLIVWKPKRIASAVSN